MKILKLSLVLLILLSFGLAQVTSETSPIVGSTNQTTVGTITTGVWNAGAVTSSGDVTSTDDVIVGDDILISNAGVVGITGNEVITFNAAGSINMTGADFDVDGAATATSYTADAGVTSGTILTAGTYLKLTAASEATITSEDSLAVNGTFMVIDTEGDAALDTVSTITGGVAGYVIIIHTAEDARDVFFDDGENNVQLGDDRTLSDTDDVLMLLYDGANWLELSYVDNS